MKESAKASKKVAGITWTILARTFFPSLNWIPNPSLVRGTSGRRLGPSDSRGFRFGSPALPGFRHPPGAVCPAAPAIRSDAFPASCAFFFPVPEPPHALLENCEALAPGRWHLHAVLTNPRGSHPVDPQRLPCPFGKST